MDAPLNLLCESFEQFVGFYTQKNEIKKEKISPSKKIKTYSMAEML